MHFKIKAFLYTTVTLLLVGPVLLMMGDPLVGGVTPPTPEALAAAGNRGLFHLVYGLSGFVMAPVAGLHHVLALLGLPVQSAAFPVMPTRLLAEPFLALWATFPALDFLGSTAKNLQNLSGGLDWLALITLGLWFALMPVLDVTYEFCRNMFWNFVVEVSFSQKVEAQYKQALEKRAVELIKLNLEYRSLSKEASQLKNTVITDELTKVYNKRFFIEKIKAAFHCAQVEQRPLALIMMDIDHFKKLNDTYGHLMGDKVLQAVARTAQQATPAGGFCCRFGGEEFAIILPDKTEEEVLAVAQTIKDSVPLLRFEADASLKITVSQGACLADFRTEDAQSLADFEALIKLGDDELYHAKLDGRNRISHHKIR